jgi:hypothetical protein
MMYGKLQDSQVSPFIIDIQGGKRGSAKPAASVPVQPSAPSRAEPATTATPGSGATASKATARKAPAKARTAKPKAPAPSEPPPVGTVVGGAGGLARQRRVARGGSE